MEFYTVIGKDMEVLGQAMEYKPSQIDHIRMEAPYSVPTQIMKMFTKWRSKKRYITLGMLRETFVKAERGGASIDWDVYNKAIITITGM